MTVEEQSKDLFASNFIYKFKINKDICDGLIKYHKNNTEYKSIGSTYDGIDKNIKDSTDVMFFYDSHHPIIKKYFSELNKGCTEYLKKYALTGLHKANRYTLIQHYKPGGGYKKFHYERGSYGTTDDCVATRSLVYMTYLNDVKIGGETEWYYQKLKVKPKKGLSLIWPTDFTHTHRGIVAPKEDKWIATGWFKFVL